MVRYSNVDVKRRSRAGYSNADAKRRRVVGYSNVDAKRRRVRYSNLLDVKRRRIRYSNLDVSLVESPYDTLVQRTGCLRTILSKNVVDGVSI